MKIKSKSEAFSRNYSGLIEWSDGKSIDNGSLELTFESFPRYPSAENSETHTLRAFWGDGRIGAVSYAHGRRFFEEKSFLVHKIHLGMQDSF